MQGPFNIYIKPSPADQSARNRSAQSPKLAQVCRIRLLPTGTHCCQFTPPWITRTGPGSLQSRSTLTLPRNRALALIRARLLRPFRSYASRTLGSRCRPLRSQGPSGFSARWSTATTASLGRSSPREFLCHASCGLSQPCLNTHRGCFAAGQRSLRASCDRQGNWSRPRSSKPGCGPRSESFGRTRSLTSPNPRSRRITSRSTP